MDLNLKDKIIVISGAAGIKGSIGETMVRAVAREGAIPVIIDRNERGYAYMEELQANGTDALFVQTDVTDPVQMQRAVDELVKKYGRIDVVINNVGVNDGIGLDGTYEAFMESLKLNLASYFLLVKFALPQLIQSGGNVLNIGSKVALTGQGGTSGYAASKGGVLALTREWAADLARHSIRVNALIIAESWTPAYQNWLHTLADGEEKRKSIVERIPFGKRMTTPDEIADMAMFLISGQSSHTTGQYLFVDGGYVHLDRSVADEMNDTAPNGLA